MTLQQQTISVPFGVGLDLKTSALRTPLGKLVACENGVFLKAGELAKRCGYTSLGNVIEGSGADIASRGAVLALATCGDELLAINADCTAYTRVSATGHWVSRGSASVAHIEDYDIVKNTNEQRVPDSVVVAGLRIVVWEERSGASSTHQGCYYSVQDVETGAFLVNGTSFVGSSGVCPMVHAHGDYAVLTYIDGVSVYEMHIQCRTTPTTISSAVALIGDTSSGVGPYDAIRIGDRLFFVWHSTVNGVSAAYLDSTCATFSSALTVDPSFPTACVACAEAANQVLSITWGETATPLIGAARVSYTLTLIAALTTAVAAAPVDRMTHIVNTTTDTGSCVYETASGVCYRTVTPAGSLSAETVILRTFGLASKLWKIGQGTQYFVAEWASAEQASYFACKLGTTPRVVARFAYGTGGGARQRKSLAHGAATESSTAFEVARQEVIELDTSVAAPMKTRTGLTVTRIDHAPASRIETARAGRGLVIAGAAPQFYDGQQIVDLGFHLYPEGGTATRSASAGSLTAGVYQYTFTYEWTDALGQIHRSAPMTPVSITSLGADSCDLVIPTLRIGALGAAVRLVIYRTAVNGSLFYRVSALSAPTLNTTAATTVSVSDTAADTAITSNELLYTTGSVLENITPGAAKHAVAYRGRVWLAGLEAENTIAYSKIVRDGDAPAFNDSLTVAIDPAGGAVTGLGVIDDKLVIFKRDRIFVLSGDGPADTGAGQLFGDPQMVTTETGCSTSASIVQTPQGLMFMSPKGIYLLDRSLTASYIGAAVEEYNSLTVVGARTTTDASCRVMFWTEEGPALVYDYEFGQWSTWTNTAATSATTWLGGYVFVRSDGTICREASTTYTDDGAFIRLRATFGWIAVAGIQGFERLYRLRIAGLYYGAHSLRMRLAYDYDPAWVNDGQIDVGSLLPVSTYGGSSPYGDETPYGGVYPVYRFEMRPSVQKCQAVRVCVEDVQTTDYNQGVTFVDLSLVIATKRGPQRLASTRVGQVA